MRNIFLYSSSVVVDAKHIKQISFLYHKITLWHGADSDSWLSQLCSASFPESSNLEQHLLLFVSALIPKAFSSLITSFLLAMAGDAQVGGS